MVEMRHHGHEGADLAIFCRGGRCEDGKVGIARKVSRATNPVHHTSTIYVGRVNIPKDVGFEGGIDGDNPQSAHDLGIIRILYRTKQQLVFEEVEIAVYFLDYRATYR